ncbi:MAG: hypothetical protein R2781_05930 [Flavobacteriaceae bacterium]
MKQPILKFLFVFLISFATQAQVGVGTTAPKGALDVQSNTYGVVYPTVALTSTIIELPVDNPIADDLAIGTTVYNTNSTNTGANDVHPGIYTWDGTKWVADFFKRQSQLYQQATVLRSASNLGFQDVPGLGFLSFNSFTAEYTGLYKIEVKANFGGGRVNTGVNVNTAMIEGQFRFVFGTDNYTFTTKAYSTYNSHISGGTHYVNRWKETYITKYVALTAGVTYPLYLQFDQYNAPDFQFLGNLGNGLGYVGSEIPCFIEITYIDE